LARRGGRSYLATLKQLRLASRDFDVEGADPDDRLLLRFLNLNMQQGLVALSVRSCVQAAADTCGSGEDAPEGYLPDEQEHDPDQQLLA
jgi:hypothetical protein